MSKYSTALFLLFIAFGSILVSRFFVEMEGDPAFGVPTLVPQSSMFVIRLNQGGEKWNRLKESDEFKNLWKEENAKALHDSSQLLEFPFHVPDEMSKTHLKADGAGNFLFDLIKTVKTLEGKAGIKFFTESNFRDLFGRDAVLAGRSRLLKPAELLLVSRVGGRGFFSQKAMSRFAMETVEEAKEGAPALYRLPGTDWVAFQKGPLIAYSNSLPYLQEARGLASLDGAYKRLGEMDLLTGDELASAWFDFKRIRGVLGSLTHKGNAADLAASAFTGGKQEPNRKNVVVEVDGKKASVKESAPPLFMKSLFDSLMGNALTANLLDGATVRLNIHDSALITDVEIRLDTKEMELKYKDYQIVAATYQEAPMPLNPAKDDAETVLPFLPDNVLFLFDGQIDTPAFMKDLQWKAKEYLASPDAVWDNFRRELEQTALRRNGFLSTMQGLGPNYGFFLNWDASGKEYDSLDAPLPPAVFYFQVPNSEGMKASTIFRDHLQPAVKYYFEEMNKNTQGRRVVDGFQPLDLGNPRAEAYRILFNIDVYGADVIALRSQTIQPAYMLLDNYFFMATHFSALDAIVRAKTEDKNRLLDGSAWKNWVTNFETEKTFDRYNCLLYQNVDVLSKLIRQSRSWLASQGGLSAAEQTWVLENDAILQGEYHKIEKDTAMSRFQRDDAKNEAFNRAKDRYIRDRARANAEREKSLYVLEGWSLLARYSYRQNPEVGQEAIAFANLRGTLKLSTAK